MMALQEAPESSASYEQESKEQDGHEKTTHDFSKNCPLLGLRIFTLKIISSTQRHVADLYLGGLAIDPLDNICLDQPN